MTVTAKDIILRETSSDGPWGNPPFWVNEAFAIHDDMIEFEGITLGIRLKIFNGYKKIYFKHYFEKYFPYDAIYVENDWHSRFSDVHKFVIGDKRLGIDKRWESPNGRATLDKLFEFPDNFSEIPSDRLTYLRHDISKCYKVVVNKEDLNNVMLENLPVLDISNFIFDSMLYLPEDISDDHLMQLSLLSYEPVLVDFFS